MKALCTFVLALAAFVGASPLPQKAEKLAVNTVVALYTGTVHHPCMFRTALCPDRCGHATDLAQFKVLSNEGYTKNGQYGDEKMEPGSVAVVDVLRDVPGQAPTVAAEIAELHPGDKVRLVIAHYYVTQGQVQFPVRPAVSIEVLPKEGKGCGAESNKSDDPKQAK